MLFIVFFLLSLVFCGGRATDCQAAVFQTGELDRRYCGVIVEGCRGDCGEKFGFGRESEDWCSTEDLWKAVAYKSDWPENVRSKFH